MVSSIGSQTALSSSLANSGSPPDTSTPLAANDAAADTSAAGGDSPAVQITISAEAELTMMTSETMQITATAAGGGATDSSAPQDPNTTKALSTLKAVAQNERDWIKSLKASHEGKKASTSDATNSASPANTSSTSGAQAGGVQITVQQETQVQVSLSVSAQVDIQA